MMIDRDKLHIKLLDMEFPICDQDPILDAMDDCTVEAPPVVHGRWIEGAENFTCGNHNAECSVCGANISWNGCDEDFNYCPNCGAKMDLPDGE